MLDCLSGSERDETRVTTRFQLAALDAALRPGKGANYRRTATKKACLRCTARKDSAFCVVEEGRLTGKDSERCLERIS